MATISTQKAPPPAKPPTYSDGWFVRDYDMSNACPSGTSVTWGLWSWTATTPSDSRIEFLVQTATSPAGLASAPTDALLFSDPPGPSALASLPAVAKVGVPDTQGGSVVVDTTLATKGRPRVDRFLRVSSHLIPSTDQYSAPTLNAWNLQADCTPSE
jgi:hypothetical protein